MLYRRVLKPLGILLALALGLVVGGCVAPSGVPPVPSPASPPALAREFRGAWIATVDNIDWPSRPGLPVASQQAELRGLLDRAAVLNLNAIVFQVRPTADALYASPYEPWSAYLTGEQGRAPEPFYDPLAFAVEEAHRRGLELHAWFNPYRAYHPTAAGPLAAGHISRTHPDVVRAYGDLLWLDPGEPAAEEHSLRVILDVVARYDVDGVHLDDYFYPYPVQDSLGREVPFPDSTSRVKARAAGVTLDRDDWRRQNIDRFVERLYHAIKAEKPWVKFGISPFGIWRPGHPEQIQGFDAYAKLYADARKWLAQGWVDYFTPQLYWPIDRPAQSYPVLLDWWITQNSAHRHLWPGNFTSRVIAEGERRWDAGEIVRQIAVTRATEGASGNVHFSMKALMPGPDMAGAALAAGPYREPAFVPASPWLDDRVPGRPTLAVERLAGAPVLTMMPSAGAAVWLWGVRARYGSTWTVAAVPGWRQSYRLAPVGITAFPDEVVVTALSRTGMEGPAARLVLDAGS